MKAWHRTKWGALASLEYGRALRGYEAQAGPYRVFGTNGPIGWHTVGQAQGPSVIVGRKGAYRGIHFSAEPFWVIDTAFYLKARPDVHFDMKWAYYQLRTVDLNRLDTGAAIPSTSREVFYEIPVFVPPVTEQLRIAAILGTYDDLIEVNRRRIAVLEEMARRLFEEWFVHFRFPGHEATPWIHTALGKVPEGWQVLDVKDVVHRLPNGTVYKASDVAPAGLVPVIDQSTSEVLGFHNDLPSHLATPDAPVVIFGDHTCKMQLMVVPFSLGPNTVAFVAKGLPVHYVFAVVRGLVTTHEYKRHWSDLLKKKVIVASSSLAAKYAALVCPLAEMSESLRKQIRCLSASRDLLLPRLVSGDVEVATAERELGLVA